MTDKTTGSDAVDLDKSRAEFEVKFKLDEFRKMRRMLDADKYQHEGTQSAWEGWQAAMIAQARAAAPAAADWADAQRICDLPTVDEAIRGLLEDSTGDNATCLVREVMRALSQQPVQATGEELPKNVDRCLFNWGNAVLSGSTDDKVRTRKDLIAAIRYTREDAVREALGAPAATSEPVAVLIDALRNIRDYRTDVTAEVAAKAMRFYAELALSDLAAPAPQQAAPLTDARIRELQQAAPTILSFARAIERELSAGSAASAGDARDAARLSVFIDWYLREGKRAEVHPEGATTVTTREHVIAWLDRAAMAATKENKQ